MAGRPKSTKKTLHELKQEESKAGLNVYIDRDLRQWAKDDARRSGYTFPEYIEALIKARQGVAPPLDKKVLINIT